MEDGAQDVTNQVDANPALALEKLDAWVDGFFRLLPNIGVGLVVVLVAWGVATGVASLIRSRSSSKGRDNLGEVLGGFAWWAVMVLGVLLAATIVAPSLKPGDLIAGLGVSSVAIGFAFKDILQNWLAGLLILLRQPFEVGDQVKVGDFEGTVERIETRATLLKTYDGQRVVIPNSDIYTSSVLVRTAFEQRRSQYDVGIGYADDIEQAQQVMLEAVRGVDGVASEPAPEVLPWDLAASWVTLRARWWTESPRADVVQVHARVVRAVKRALDEAAIDMPYETRVHLWHDQTEAADGDRSAQREGWPAPNDGGTKPRWEAVAERADEDYAGADAK
jgi:small-conductance mechanosensitive channel